MMPSNPSNLQSFTRRAVPGVDLAFEEIYFASGANLVVFQLCFKVPGSAEIGSSQQQRVISKLGMVDLLDPWDNFDV